MDEMTRRIFACGLMFLLAFVIQSLPVVYSRSTLHKLLPLLMFWIPLECVVKLAWECGDPWEALTKYGLLLLPMIAGNVLGWVLGLRFRKIIDSERTAEPESDNEPM